jgi:hypothetical protein
MDAARAEDGQLPDFINRISPDALTSMRAI